MTQKQIDAALDALQQRINDGIYRYGNVMEIPDYDQILSEIQRLNGEIPDEQPYIDVSESKNDIEK